MNEETRFSWRALLAYVLLALFVIAPPVGAFIEFGIGIGLIILGFVSLVGAYFLGAR